jgi:hypothetical protein
MLQLSRRNTAKMAPCIVRFAPQLDGVTSQALEFPANSAHEAAMQSEQNSAAEQTQIRKRAARRAWRFGAIVTLILTMVMIALAAVTRLDIFSAGFHVSFAMALGGAGVILLGVGLMALSFYSDRSGVDDGVIGMNEEQWSDEP